MVILPVTMVTPTWIVPAAASYHGDTLSYCGGIYLIVSSSTTVILVTMVTPTWIVAAPSCYNGDTYLDSSCTLLH